MISSDRGTGLESVRPGSFFPDGAVRPSARLTRIAPVWKPTVADLDPKHCDDPSGGDRGAPWFIVFCACVCLLTASGRLGNADAADQFYAANHLALTGRLGINHAPGGLVTETIAGRPREVPRRYFWQAPNGLYYQTHDLGNLLLFLPVSALTARLDEGDLHARLENPHPAAEALASLWFALQGVVLAWVLRSMLLPTVGARLASGWGAGLLLCTFTVSYTRMPWDVTGAALAGLLAWREVLRISRQRDARAGGFIRLGLFLALCGTFRYSYAPFLIVGCGLALAPLGKRLKPAHLGLCAFTLLICLLPQLFYNEVRTGSFLTPATVIPRYPTRPEFSFDMLAGLGGLLFSPDKGLLVYCPFLLVLFGAARSQVRIGAMGWGIVASSLLYALVIGGLPDWRGGNSWSTRYLLPTLPALVWLAANVTWQLGNLGKRAVAAGLLAGFLVNAPSFVINWPLAVAEAYLRDSASGRPFAPQRAVWQAFMGGVQGRPIAVRDAGRIANDSSRQFPDVFAAHLARAGGKAALAAWGYAGALGLLLLVALARYRSLSSPTEAPRPVEPSKPGG